MLAELEHIKTVPQLKNQPKEYLEMLLRWATQMVKDYVKQNIEEADYTEFYSGKGTPTIFLKQTPVSEITALYFDPTGYFGKRAQSFGSQTLLTEGTQFILELDGGGQVSNRGIIRSIAGIGLWFPNSGPVSANRGKLAARSEPVWPIGYGNIKVEYTAGYPKGEIPTPIQAAVIMVAAFMAANLPSGGILQTESLGAYSYSRYFRPMGSLPELGTVCQSLAIYREVSI